MEQATCVLFCRILSSNRELGALRGNPNAGREFPLVFKNPTKVTLLYSLLFELTQVRVRSDNEDLRMEIHARLVFHIIGESVK